MLNFSIFYSKVLLVYKKKLNFLVSAFVSTVQNWSLRCKTGQISPGLSFRDIFEKPSFVLILPDPSLCLIRGKHMNVLSLFWIPIKNIWMITWHFHSRLINFDQFWPVLASERCISHLGVPQIWSRDWKNPRNEQLSLRT